MTVVSTEKNSSQSKNRPHRGAQAHYSWVVVPLLLICSMVLSGYMVLGSASSGKEHATLIEVPVERETVQNDIVITEDAEGTSQEATPADEVIIGSYRAVSASDEEGRVENIRLATEAINNVVIHPGETFSFNELVGDTGENEEYQMAPVINSDGLVYGRGGGSCQVSTALYHAALFTDLEIVERHPHSAAVDYTTLGLDATVVYGVMDLKIANVSEFPVTIIAEAEGQSVNVMLMGHPRDEGTWTKPVSLLLEYHVAGTPVPNALEWDPELENTTYYVVESYREYYAHGSKTGSELLSRDRYMILSDTIVRMPDGGVESTK